MKLHKLIEISLAAHDIETLKKAHFLAGIVFVDSGNPSEAIQHYKHLRNIVESYGENNLKFHIYTEMGLCYQQMKEYKKAIRAFKKLLEVAWKTNNKQEETKAFDYIGIQ